MAFQRPMKIGDNIWKNPPDINQSVRRILRLKKKIRRF